MGLLDAPALSRVEALKRLSRGFEGLAWLGDSLTAFGSNPGSLVLNLDSAAAVGATSITVSSPYAAYPSPVSPASGMLVILDPGTVNEEHIVTGAVAGTGPYTITVPALAKAHAAGAAIRTEARQWGAKSIPMWTHLLSNGRLRFVGVFAHGSYTAQHIQTVYLPQVIAAKPAACVVLAGTNPGTYDLTDIPNYIIPMWDSLTANGILPIVQMLPPNNASKSSSGYRVQRFNARLAYEARHRGLPVFDTYGNLVDPGDGAGGPGAWVVTYNADDVHPSEIGARVWAQGIVTLLDQRGILRPFDAPLVATQRSNGDTATYPLSGSLNNLLQTDTDADGVPDGWTGTKGQAGDTFALGAVAGIKGNAMTITRVAAGAADPVVQSPAWVGVPGHKYRVSFKVKTSGVDAAYDNVRASTATATTSPFPGFDVRVTNAAVDTDNLFSIKTWNRDIAAVTTVEMEYVHPKGLSGDTMHLHIQLRGTPSTPAYSLTIGQFQPVDLTALGI